MKSAKWRRRLKLGLLGLAVAAMAAEQSELPPLPPPPPPRRPRPATNQVPAGSRTQSSLNLPGATNLPGARPTLPVLRPPLSSNYISSGTLQRPPYWPAVPSSTGLMSTSGVGRMVTNVLLAPQTIPYVPLQQEKALAWDALIKEYSAKTGELSAKFAFSLTNISDTNVTISRVRTSCGCTVAKVPTNIWTVPPGSNGTFEVVADLRGKSGVITKVVTVDTTAGYRFLTLRVSIPATPLTANTLALRARNLQVAMVDRQLVFKGDCAICHLQPAVGKTDEALYRAACGVCHEAEHRASMVPNLHALNRPTDQEYWRNWITKGKPNTLMPAWALPEGGPLLEGQINSLIEYVMGPFKTQPCLDQPPKQAASALPGTVPLPVGAGPSMPAGPAANTNQQPPGAARLPTE